MQTIVDNRIKKSKIKFTKKSCQKKSFSAKFLNPVNDYLPKVRKMTIKILTCLKQ